MMNRALADAGAPLWRMTAMKTLTQLIADRGIDESREVSLMRRRAAYALTRDRTKIYASSHGVGAVWGTYTRQAAETDLLVLKLASSTGSATPDIVTTADYVHAWCRLNHLKP
jgi:hypothetical protein